MSRPTPLKSLRVELQVIDGHGLDGGGEPGRERPALALAGPKKRTDSQAQGIQRDRDLADRSGRQAALQARPPPHLVYRAQAATDPKAR
jgi:hypothetical protein